MTVSIHTCAWFYVKDGVPAISFKAHLEMIYFRWKVIQFFLPKSLYQMAPGGFHCFLEKNSKAIVP